VEKDALIWCLRNDINLRAILSLHPTIRRDVISRCIFHHTDSWIISPIKVADSMFDRDSDLWMRNVALAHFGIQSLTIARLTDVKVAQEVREH
jgi:hypothetical protein